MPECAISFDIERRSKLITCVLVIIIIGCCALLTIFLDDPHDAPLDPTTPSPLQPAGCLPALLDEGCCTPDEKCPLGHGGCTTNDDCMKGHCAASQYQIAVGGRFLKVCLSGAAYNTTSGNFTGSTHMETQSAEEEDFNKQDYFWKGVFTWSAMLIGLAAFGWLCYLYRDPIELHLKETWDKIKVEIWGLPELRQDFTDGVRKLAKRGHNQLLALYEEYVPNGKKMCPDSLLTYGFMDLRQDLARSKIAWTGKRRIDAMYYIQYNHSLLLMFKVNRCDPRSRPDVIATLILATLGAVFVKDQTMKNIHHLPDSMESPWWPGIMVAFYMQVLVSVGGMLATCSRYQKDNVEAEKRKTAERTGTAILVFTAFFMFAYIVWKCTTDKVLRSHISSTLIGIFTTWVLEYVWLYGIFHGYICHPFANSWEEDMKAQKKAHEDKVQQKLEEAKGDLERHRNERRALSNVSEMVHTGDEEHKEQEAALQKRVDELENDKKCELNLYEYIDKISLNKDIMSVTSDIALLWKYQSDETQFFYFEKLPEDIEEGTDSKAEEKAEVAPRSGFTDAGSGSMVDQPSGSGKLKQVRAHLAQLSEILHAARLQSKPFEQVEALQHEVAAMEKEVTRLEVYETISTPVIYYTEAGTGGTTAEAQGLQSQETLV